jgi:hypothetical protein
MHRVVGVTIHIAGCPVYYGIYKTVQIAYNMRPVCVTHGLFFAEVAEVPIHCRVAVRTSVEVSFQSYPHSYISLFTQLS